MSRQGLCLPPHKRQDKDDLYALINQLGFVQMDSIRTVERAHHMILHTRNRTYRPAQLTRLLEDDRSLFENWTHDAAVIPTRFYPYWQSRFRSAAIRLRKAWRKRRQPGFEAALDAVRERFGYEAIRLGLEQRSRRHIRKPTQGPTK